MKKLIIVLVFIITSIHAFAGNQTRLTGQWAMQSEKSSILEAASARQALHLGGIGVEHVTKNFGFGGSTMFSFQEYSSGFWNMKMDTQMFISYHILDNQNVFDPFILAGVGAKLDMDIKNTYIVKSRQHGETQKYYKYRRRSVTRKGVSLYPYIGAGVGLNFESGIYLSGRFHWKPHFTKLPTTDYPRADEIPFELIISVGYSFNRNNQKSK